ncbi:MAG: acyltransferase [Vicingaceae bacterium]
MASNQQRDFFPFINFLRAFAVIMICLYHFTRQQHLGTSFVPEDNFLYQMSESAIYLVHLFFVISGFVIPLSLHRSGYSISSYHLFMLRRIIRIGLPYLLVIVLILTKEWLFALKNQSVLLLDWGKILHHLTFTVGFTDNQWYNPIFWTLAIEIQFYLLAGLIYPLLVLQRSWGILLTLFLFALSSVVFARFELLSLFAPQFAMGMLLFCKQVKKISRREYLAGLLVLVAMLCFQNYLIALASLIGVLSIDLIRIDKKWINFLGDASYSLYLTHGLAGGSFIYLLADFFYALNNSLICIIALIISIAFSIVYWRFVEKPSHYLSRQIKIKSKA